MGTKVKIVGVALFAAGSYFAISEGIKFTNHQLDVFATNRVESRELPITKTEVKVFVTDGKEVIDAAKEAAKQGASEGSNQAINNALSGKR